MSQRILNQAFTKYFLDSKLRIGRVIECQHGRAVKLAYNKHAYPVDLHCKHISYLKYNQWVLFSYIEQQVIVVAEVAAEESVPCQLMSDHYHYTQINKGDTCFAMHRDGGVFMGNKHASLEIKHDGNYFLKATSIMQQAEFEQRLLGYPIHLN